MFTKEYKLQAVWSIKKETFLNSQESIKSEIFSTTLPNVAYQFVLCPEFDGKKYTTIHVLLKNHNGKKYPLDELKIKQMDLYISSANIHHIVNDDSSNLFFSPYNGVDRTVFIRREFLLNPEKNYFVNDILTMEIRGILSYEKLFMDLGQILLEKDNKDFTIYVGSKEIKAHKFMLRQFSSILGHGDSDEITIENFKYDTVEKAVELCYGIEYIVLVGFIKDAFQLIQLTNTFEMPFIKEKLEYKLAEKIMHENVCEMANKSVELKAEILRCFCVNFLSDCIKNGKPFNGTLNDLNLEIRKLVFDNSFCHTQTL